jgi:phosphoserine phosphatase
MPKIKLVAFDLDGTLVEEKSSWRKVHEFFGTEEKSDEGLKLYVDGKINYEQFVAHDLSLWPKGISKNVFNYVFSKIPLNEGAREVVTEIKRRGKLVAIVSSGISLLAEKVSKELGVDFFIANEILFDEKGRSTGVGVAAVDLNKKGEALLKILEKANIKPKEVLGVGDSKFDLSFLKICGYSVLLRRKGSLIENEKYEVNFVIDSLHELIKVIDIIEKDDS